MIDIKQVLLSFKERLINEIINEIVHKNATGTLKFILEVKARYSDWDNMPTEEMEVIEYNREFIKKDIVYLFEEIKLIEEAIDDEINRLTKR